MGDIKGAAHVTNPICHLKVFVTAGSHVLCLHIIELPPPVHNHLPQHLTVATALLVM